MKHIKLFEQFKQELHSQPLNEKFNSSKLRSILTTDKGLPAAFYEMSKLKLDQISDDDIIEMDPNTAKKEKRRNAVYFYFTDSEKTNPHAGEHSYGVSKIPANTLLGITNSANKFYEVDWVSRYSNDRKRKLSNTRKTTMANTVGYDKTGGKYGSGITSMTKVANLADRAYVIDLDVLNARLSAQSLLDQRAEAQKGATAFQSDKDFKAANINRYNEIIKDRVASMPIDKLVKDAIDNMTKQIADGIASGEKGKYGDIIVGKTPKGREAKLSDAASHMQRILREFESYVKYTDDAEKEKAAGYDGNYYANSVKQSAKDISDLIKQIDNFTYAW